MNKKRTFIKQLLQKAPSNSKKEPVRRASRKYLNSALERAELVGNWMKFSTSNFLAYPLAVIYSEFFPSARMFRIMKFVLKG